MKDVLSYSSGGASASASGSFPDITGADTKTQRSSAYRITDDLSSLPTISLFSKGESKDSTYPSTVHSTKKSSKRSQRSAVDEREDNSGWFSRDDHDHARQSPVRPKSSIYSKQSNISTNSISWAPIPRDLVVQSKKPNSIKSSKSMPFRAPNSIKGNKSMPVRATYSSGGNMEFWASLSVIVSMAVLQSGGSDKIAKKLSNLVLATGKKKGKKHDKETLIALSTKLSSAVLDAGGEEKVASAVSLAMIKSAAGAAADEDDRIKMIESESLSGSFHIHRKHHSNDEYSTKDAPSVTASMAEKRKQLEAKEVEIKRKTKELEAARRMAEKRKQLQAKTIEMERKMKELEAATMAKKQRQIEAKEKELEEKIALHAKAKKEKSSSSSIKSKLSSTLSGKSNTLKKAKSASSQEESEYWGSLSVRVAAAVLQAGGSHKIAQKVSNTVLSAGRKQKGEELNRKTKISLSAQLVSVVLEAGGEDKVVSAVSRAVMGNDVHENANMSGDGYKKTINTESPSVTVSMASKRRQIKDKEIEIERRMRKLEETEHRNKLKEKELKRKLKVVATREQSIFGRLAVADEASISRREKEREVEQRCIDFDLREQEINDRLAAIDAASVARRKKEQVIEEKIISFAMREQEIDDRLASLDAASVIARQKREVKRKEIEMEETLKLMELNEKELLIAEKNTALEEALQLNMQREIEIKEIMAALDSATTALMEKANQKTGQQMANQKSTLSEPGTNTEGVSFYERFTNTLYNVLQCNSSCEATLEPPENGDKSESKGRGNFSVESDDPETNYPEVDTDMDVGRTVSTLSQSNGVRPLTTPNAGAKQINQSLNGALKASYNLYDFDTGLAPPPTTHHIPSTPEETGATDGNLALPDRECDENTKGGKKKKFKMFSRNRKK